MVRNQAVQGAMELTSFDSRKAGSKIKLDQRLIEMENTRQAMKVQHYMYMKGLNGKWTFRSCKMSTVYRNTTGS